MRTFCSPVTFVNQLINRIRTALLPRLSVIGQGRCGAARQREAAESPHGGRRRCPGGSWGRQRPIGMLVVGSEGVRAWCLLCGGDEELTRFPHRPDRSVQARAGHTQGQGRPSQPACIPSFDGLHCISHDPASETQNHPESSPRARRVLCITLPCAASLLSPGGCAEAQPGGLSGADRVDAQ